MPRKKSAAVVGVGNTDFGAMYRNRDVRHSAEELIVQAFQASVQDSGVEKSRIDGLIAVRSPGYQRVSSLLGLDHLRQVIGLEGTGRMSGIALDQATNMISEGRAETVAIVYGNDGRSQAAKYGGSYDPDAPVAYEAAFGLTSPGAYVGLMFQRYRYEFGSGQEGLAHVAVNNRANASANPVAVFREPLGFDQYYDARYITEPLRLYDYCLINDGAVALIVTRADLATDLRKSPAYIAGSAVGAQLTNSYFQEDFFRSPTMRVANEVYGRSGISRDDVDCLQIYDNFTPTVLFSLEGMGFCGPGEAEGWLKANDLGPGASLPFNTSGGHTSESYMQGFALLVEAVRQVRGDAGDRQVNDCKVAQYVCVSPIVSSILFHR